MPAKRKAKAKKTKRKKASPQQGAGFFGDAWKWTKGAAGTINKAAKKTKIVSRGLALIPNKRAQLASEAASQLGYGSNSVVKARASDFR